jgi:hypothetical protein
MENYTEIQIAMLDYLTALRKIRQLNIAPNSKDFTSQLGEWLTEQLFDGKRAESGIQKSWDVIAENKKIQVKTHAKAKTTNARWSYIKFDIQADLDELIIIVFSDEYKLKEFIKVNWSKALPLIKHEKDGDKIYWNHLKEFQVEINELPKQEIISLFR